MRTLIVIAAAMLLSSPALAKNEGNENGNGCRNRCGDTVTNTTNNTTNNNPKATATAKQSQEQGQSQAQGQLQGQAQKATANNDGNTQEVSIAFNEAKQRLQAPGHGVGGSNATAICVLPIYGGISVPGASLSLGTTYRDEICTLTEYGQKFMTIGAAGDDIELFIKGYVMVKEAARRVADMYLVKNSSPAKAAFDTTDYTN